MSYQTLESKVALVTGASSGIGAATAEALAKAGAKVVLAARRADRGQEVVDRIKAAGGDATFIQLDVTQDGQAEAVVQKTVETYGGLHVLFNNAGIEGEKLIPLVEDSEQNLRNILEVNVIGAWRVLKAAVPAIISSGGGSIISNTSVAGRKGFGTFSAYVSSKFALEGLSRSLAQEVAGAGVRVNTVAPGPIATDLLDRATGGDHDQFAQFTHMQRAGTVDEIAETVVFLAGDGASYITGQSIAVDGGMLA